MKNETTTLTNGELEFPNVSISVIDQNTAVLVNEFMQTMQLKNGNVMTFCGGGTQVWSKQSGGWKLVSISASNKPDCNPPKK